MKTLIVFIILLASYNVNAQVFLCNGVYTNVVCENAQEVILNPTNSMTSENSAYDLQSRRKEARAKYDASYEASLARRARARKTKRDQAKSVCKYNRAVHQHNMQYGRGYAPRTSIYDKQWAC